MKHKIMIDAADRGQRKTTGLITSERKLMIRLLRIVFGYFTQVYVFSRSDE